MLSVGEDERGRGLAGGGGSASRADRMYNAFKMYVYKQTSPH